MKKFLIGLIINMMIIFSCQAPDDIEVDTVENIPHYKIVPGSWSVIVIPDTQWYTTTEDLNYYLSSMFLWIRLNSEKYNIKFVFHEGDITYYHTPDEWECFKKGTDLIYGKVPIALTLGNHDYNDLGTRLSIFGNYYNPSNFPVSFESGDARIESLFQSDDITNACYSFSANGRNYLVFSLEFGPRNPVVAWVDSVIAAHPGYRAFIVTHAFLYTNNTRYDWDLYGTAQIKNPHSYECSTSPDGCNDAQDIWDALINNYNNFSIIFSGHVFYDGLGYRVDTSSYGNYVHQFLFDLQNETDGGQGFIRIISFLPDNTTIRVMTYSPVLATWRTDSENQFELTINN